jgi:hypothetical protein
MIRAIRRSTGSSNCRTFSRRDGPRGVGSISFGTQPSVTTTQTDTYALPADPVTTAWAIGTAVHIDTQSANESLNGSGASVDGLETTTTSSSDEQHISFGVDGWAPSTAGTNFSQHTSETDTVVGSDAPGGAGLSETDTNVYLHDLTENIQQNIAGISPGVTEVMNQTHSQTDDRTVTTSLNGPSGTPGTVTGASGSGTDNTYGSNVITGPAGAATTSWVTSDSWTYGAPNGAVIEIPGVWSGKQSGSGTDPDTGADATYGPIDMSDPSSYYSPPGDWFSQLASFGAGMGDAVSGGLTKRARQGMGYETQCSKRFRAGRWKFRSGCRWLSAALQKQSPFRQTGPSNRQARPPQGAGRSVRAVRDQSMDGRGAWLRSRTALMAHDMRKQTIRRFAVDPSGG